jgi:ComF family protein
MQANANLTAFTAAVKRAAPGWRAVVGALRSALPQACVLCAGASDDAMICDRCAAAMPHIAQACPRCALATPDAALCGKCLATPPAFDAACAAWRYDFPVDRLLQAFKYGGRLALAEPVAHALADAVRRRDSPLPDRLIAVPLAAARQRQRGFNQAHEIARRLSERLGIPHCRALVRTRDSPPQAGLALRDRARNVRDAFEATASLAGLRVAIIDDVMTTGATLAAAARAARAAGAVCTEAWAVARTLSGIRDRVSVRSAHSRKRWHPCDLIP